MADPTVKYNIPLYGIKEFPASMPKEEMDAIAGTLYWDKKDEADNYKRYEPIPLPDLEERKKLKKEDRQVLDRVARYPKEESSDFAEYLIPDYWETYQNYSNLEAFGEGARWGAGFPIADAATRAVEGYGTDVVALYNKVKDKESSMKKENPDVSKLDILREVTRESGNPFKNTVNRFFDEPQSEDFTKLPAIQQSVIGGIAYLPQVVHGAVIGGPIVKGVAATLTAIPKIAKYTAEFAKWLETHRKTQRVVDAMGSSAPLSLQAGTHVVSEEYKKLDGDVISVLDDAAKDAATMQLLPGVGALGQEFGSAMMRQIFKNATTRPLAKWAGDTGIKVVEETFNQATMLGLSVAMQAPEYLAGNEEKRLEILQRALGENIPYLYFSIGVLKPQVKSRLLADLEFKVQQDRAKYNTGAEAGKVNDERLKINQDASNAITDLRELVNLNVNAENVDLNRSLDEIPKRQKKLLESHEASLKNTPAEIDAEILAKQAEHTKITGEKQAYLESLNPTKPEATQVVLPDQAKISGYDASLTALNTEIATIKGSVDSRNAAKQSSYDTQRDAIIAEAGVFQEAMARNKDTASGVVADPKTPFEKSVSSLQEKINAEHAKFENVETDPETARRQADMDLFDQSVKASNAMIREITAYRRMRRRLGVEGVKPGDKAAQDPLPPINAIGNDPESSDTGEQFAPPETRPNTRRKGSPEPYKGFETDREYMSQFEVFAGLFEDVEYERSSLESLKGKYKESVTESLVNRDNVKDAETRLENAIALGDARAVEIETAEVARRKGIYDTSVQNLRKNSEARLESEAKIGKLGEEFQKHGESLDFYVGEKRLEANKKLVPQAKVDTYAAERAMASSEATHRQRLAEETAAKAEHQKAIDDHKAFKNTDSGRHVQPDPKSQTAEGRAGSKATPKHILDLAGKADAIRTAHEKSVARTSAVQASKAQAEATRSAYEAAKKREDALTKEIQSGERKFNKDLRPEPVTKLSSLLPNGKLNQADTQSGANEAAARSEGVKSQLAQVENAGTVGEMVSKRRREQSVLAEEWRRVTSEADDYHAKDRDIQQGIDNENKKGKKADQERLSSFHAEKAENNGYLTAFAEKLADIERKWDAAEADIAAGKERLSQLSNGDNNTEAGRALSRLERISGAGDEETQLSMRVTGAEPFRPKNDAPLSMEADKLGAMQIVKKLEKLFGTLSIGLAKMDDGVGGYLSPLNMAIKLRKFDDFRVLGHEIGHAIHRVMWPKRSSSTINSSYAGLDDFGGQFDKELIALGVPTSAKGYTREQIVWEGVAEYFHKFMSEGSASAAKAAPLFHAFWTADVPRQSPELNKAIYKAQELIHGYVNRHPVYRFMSNLYNPKYYVNMTTLGERMVNTLENLYTAHWDRQNPARRVLTELAKRQPNQPATMAKYLALLKEINHNSNGSTGRSAYQDGLLDLFDNKIPGSESIYAILKDIPGTEGWSPERIINELDTYLTASRVVAQYKKYGRDALEDGHVLGMDLKDAQAAERAGFAQFEGIRKRLNDFERNLGKLLVQSGITTQKALDAAFERNPNHVPFRKYRPDDDKTFGSSRAASGNPLGYKISKQNQLAPVSPTMTMLHYNFLFRELAETNMVRKKLLMEMSAFARFAEKIPTQRRATDITNKEIIKGLEAAGVTGVTYGGDPRTTTAFGVAAIEKGKIDPSANLDLSFLHWEMNTQNDPDKMIVSVHHNGKVLQFKVGDRYMYDYLTGEYSKSIAKYTGGIVGKIVKIARFPAAFARASATLTPAFQAWNFFKDQKTAAINSKYGLIPFASAGRAVFDILGKSHYWEEYKRQGGGLNQYRLGDPQHLAKQLEQLVQRDPKSASEHALAWANPRKWKDLAENLGNVLEQATRVAEFKRGLKRGASLEDAFGSSGEVTLAFHRAGEVGRFLNQIIPFHNAFMQSTRQTAMLIKNAAVGDILDPEAQKRAMVSLGKGMFLITLPEVIAWNLGKDDDEINKQSPERRALNTLINVQPVIDFARTHAGEEYAKAMEDILGDTRIMAFPKPPGMGALFGTTIQSALEFGYNKNSSLFKALPDGFGINPSVGFKKFMPQIGTGFFENSPISGTPIIPESVKNLPSDMQVNSRTSETAKMIERLTGVSPLRSDYLMQQYGASTVVGARDTLEWAAKQMGLLDVGTPRARVLADIPGIGRAFTSPLAPSIYIGEFYRGVEKMEKDMTRLRALKAGDMSQVKRIQENKRINWYSGAAVEIRRVQDALTQYNEMERTLVGMKNATPEQRLKIQVYFHDQRSKLAEFGVKSLLHPDHTSLRSNISQDALRKIEGALKNN